MDVVSINIGRAGVRSSVPCYVHVHYYMNCCDGLPCIGVLLSAYSGDEFNQWSVGLQLLWNLRGIRTVMGARRGNWEGR